MIMLTSAQWIVLDNLNHNWPYRTNLNWELADKAYRQCIENEWIKDGRITLAGQGALLACPYPKG